MFFYLNPDACRNVERPRMTLKNVLGEEDTSLVAEEILTAC